MPACCSVSVAYAIVGHRAWAQASAEVDPAGDDAANPGPLARDLSPALKPRAINKAMRKVADWQLRTAESRFSTDWTYAALYDGLLAASRATGDPRYHDAVLNFAEQTGWKLGPRFAMLMMKRLRSLTSNCIWNILRRNESLPSRPRRTSCSSGPTIRLRICGGGATHLFMAPPALARLAKATGDTRYLDYMDREWWLTSGHLYDPAAHLYSRDASFLDQHEKNGAKLFWSRGNGWVLAGLARVLPYLPADYPSRARYVKQFRQMAQGGCRHSGKRRAVAQWPARSRRLHAPRGLRFGILYIRSRLGYQRGPARPRDL